MNLVLASLSANAATNLGSIGVCGDGIIQGNEDCDKGIDNALDWNNKPKCTKICTFFPYISQLKVTANYADSSNTVILNNQEFYYYTNDELDGIGLASKYYSRNSYANGDTIINRDYANTDIYPYVLTNFIQYPYDEKAMRIYQKEYPIAEPKLPISFTFEIAAEAKSAFGIKGIQLHNYKGNILGTSGIGNPVTLKLTVNADDIRDNRSDISVENGIWKRYNYYGYAYDNSNAFPQNSGLSTGYRTSFGGQQFMYLECNNSYHIESNRCVSDYGKRDANGNLVQDNKYKYEYDEFNQLVKVKDLNGKVLEEYVYDDVGNRIKKTEYTDGKQKVTYYPDSNFVREVDSSGTKDTVYYYDDDNLLARKDSSGIYFYQPDHLGSTTLITDKNGNKVGETSYLPFGAVFSGGNDKFLFTGKELDKSSLYYYGSRYYNPATARFIQPDTILQDIYDPQSLNRYSYVRNNPYKYVDPSGNFFIPLLAIPFIIGTISAGVNIISQIFHGSSIFKSTVNYGSAGKSFIIGTIAGFAGVGGGVVTESVVSGATGIIGSIVAGGSIGAASGMSAMAAGQLTSNSLYNQPITSNVFESAVSGAEWGGGIGALTGGVGASAVKSGTNSYGNRLSSSTIKNLNNKFEQSKASSISSSDIEIVPFKSGMAMGNGVKIYGNKNVVILEQSIDDYTKIQIHHHNKGPGALDVLPSTYEINPYTGKRIPVSRIVG